MIRSAPLAAAVAAAVLSLTGVAEVPAAPAGSATAARSEALATTWVNAGDSAVIAPDELSSSPTVVTSTARAARLAIGDSLLVGASALMRSRGFAVNAKVGRQFSTAPGIVRSYGSKAPRNVVIELGTNGTVTLAACRAAVRAAGTRRTVFLVTNRVPRSWQNSNNRTLRTCNHSFRSSRVYMVDWYAASARHPGWFSSDRIHPSATGRLALARLIDHRVDRFGR